MTCQIGMGGLKFQSTTMKNPDDILVLAQISIGMHGASAFTDATNMARDTGIPAFLWSLGWGLSSIVMLALTIKFAYGKSNK